MSDTCNVLVYGTDAILKAAIMYPCKRHLVSHPLVVGMLSRIEVNRGDIRINRDGVNADNLNFVKSPVIDGICVFRSPHLKYAKPVRRQFAVNRRRHGIVCFEEASRYLPKAPAAEMPICLLLRCMQQQELHFGARAPKDP